MRFWVKCGSEIEFQHGDESDHELCERCVSEQIAGKCVKSRYAVRNVIGEREFIYCHDKNTVAKQAKHISKITTNAFPFIINAAKKRSKDINKIHAIAYHNARKMNASIGQSLDKIVSLDDYRWSEDRVKLIKSKIEKSPEATAKLLLSARKSVEQVEAEYNLIEVMDLSDPFQESDLTKVKAHKLIVLGFYFYQQELSESNIYVSINETDLQINVDYGVAKSAIGQIFNNALKYCKPNTKVNVSTSKVKGFVEIEFSMVSLHFDEEEARRASEFRFRGKQADGTPGEGIGLHAVKHFMRMHNGYFKMNSNPLTCVKSGDKTYSDNTFILGFRED